MLGVEDQFRFGFDDAHDAVARGGRVERQRGVGELAKLLGAALFLGQQAVDLGLGLLAFDDVAKHEHAAGDFAVLIADRGGAVVDRNLDAVLANEQRVIRQTDDDPSASTRSTGFTAGSRVVSLMIRSTSLSGWPLASSAAQPVSDAAAGLINTTRASVVGGDHGVADAGERGPETFALIPKLGGRGRAVEPIPPQHPDKRRDREQPSSVPSTIDAIVV